MAIFKNNYFNINMVAENSAAASLPYWLVNVPKGEWPEQCPDYLKNASEKDKICLSTLDENYVRLDWDAVKELVATNRLEDFRRLPSDLRRYRQHIANSIQEYGSVMDFMLHKRLKWKDLKPQSARAFECPDDYKILLNDWPYGIDEKISHLVVWTKNVFETDPVTGDLTLQSREQIEAFVRYKFTSEMPMDQILWFKNWAALRSVKAVEHFHVMLYNPKNDFISRVINENVLSVVGVANEART